MSGGVGESVRTKKDESKTENGERRQHGDGVASNSQSQSCNEAMTALNLLA
jgi:hypothetical protein